MPQYAFKELDDSKSTLTKLVRDLNYAMNNLDQINVSTTTLVLGAAQVKASNIDFGTGANQVDASDIPITDSKGFYTGTTVEAALQEAGYSLNTFSTSFTLASSHSGYIILNSTTAFTVTLPAASGNSKLRFWIHNKNSATVTINPSTSETLDGSTTFPLYQYESLNIFSDGTLWMEGG